MIDATIEGIRRINRMIAMAAGVALMGCVLLILVAVLLRKFGVAFGGSSEISGYVMAGVASWGMSFTLTELAHVRIDLIRLRLRPVGRAVLDLLAILAVAATAVTIAFQCWPVLRTTLVNHSHANTSMGTPLWIPQSIWFAGWIWFALSASLLVLLTVLLLARGDLQRVDALVGARSEMELEQ